jgi:diguanylate cyclase (GGDEF)-like protein
VLERATQMRDLIAQCAIPWEKRTIQVTASIGLYCQTLRPGTDVAQVLDRADDAMYEAKKLGRNRVVDITH